MVHSSIVAAFSLLLSLTSLSQANENSFRLTVINNSPGGITCNVQGDDRTDTVMAGQKRDIVFELSEDQVSFYLNLAFFPLAANNSFPASYSYKQIRILNNTGSKEITVSQEGKLQYLLTPEEKTIATKDAWYRTKNFWKLDSVVLANRNNIAAAEIIYLSICGVDIPIDTIRKYYALLSPEIQASGFGKRIIHYLESRGRLAVGNAFPVLALPDTAGKIIRLEDIKSDYVLLDFWFSRCGPCIASFPELETLYTKTRRTKLQIVGISVDGKGDQVLWKETIDKYRLPWINVNDVRYKLVSLLAIGNYPTRVLLGKDRKIMLLDTDNSQDDFFKRIEKQVAK